MSLYYFLGNSLWSTVQLLRFQVKRVKEPGLMRKWIGVFLLAILFLLAGCSKPLSETDNYPYEPDTPLPDAHEGTFVSSHGKMVFDGDGESIIIDFDKELAEAAGLPEGRQEGEYVFLSGDLPPRGSFPVRYDIAHEIQITADGKSAVIDLGIASEDGKSAKTGANVVTADQIPMLLSDDGFFSVVFRKEEK